MNQANFKIRFYFLVRNFRVLIVAAMISTVQVATATSEKFQKGNVDTDSAELSGEHLLYSKIIDSYRLKNLNEVARAVELMQKAYPRSVHTDNALYLKAELALAKGQHQNCLDTIETLMRSYPSSNKRVSALYLKAEVLNQAKQAQAAAQAHTEIQKRYPGSIEAAKLYSQRTLQQ